MFKYNNTHIFTGYLKQFLSSFNLPTCRIYTREFAQYREQYGKEDPRILESFDTISKDRLAVRINYLKNNELYNYFWNYVDFDTKVNLGHDNINWKRASSIYYDSDKAIPGLTKTLYSPGCVYDSATHEYLGEYLRFIRDYHNVNLLPLYNCFNDKICNNINLNFALNLSTSKNTQIRNLSADKEKEEQLKVTFDSQDSKYRIYAIPVKLFANYTIAIDSNKGVEMFCGLYNTTLDTSDKAIDLITRTYQKISRTIFKQPFLYDKLNINYWTYDKELSEVTVADSQGQKRIKTQLNTDIMSRWDLANREQDLKLFIKVPTSGRSSITILEGDFRHFNDTKYQPDTEKKSTWKYEWNHSVINFGDKGEVDIDDVDFKPIGKLQLLEFNTGESYPFANRLVEYLCGSAITPLDPISDNIKRVQRVMEQNQHYFNIEGLWEEKMQKIIYDYITNSGPIEIDNEKLVDKHRGTNPKYHGYHTRLGHTSKSMLYDVLGYVDKDAEKWYASWTKSNGQPKVRDTIQNVDIYGGLYDL